MDIVVEPETCDPWTHHVLSPGMTCCVLHTEPDDHDGSDEGPVMDALLSALVERDEEVGRAWVVHVSGPADEVDRVVREAGHDDRPTPASERGSTESSHATFVLQPWDRSASDLIGVDRGQDRVIALLGVRADRAEFVARSLERGHDVDAVAAADVLITQQPRLGRSTVARRTPPPPLPVSSPRAATPVAAAAAVVVPMRRAAAVVGPAAVRNVGFHVAGPMRRGPRRAVGLPLGVGIATAVAALALGLIIENTLPKAHPPSTTATVTHPATVPAVAPATRSTPEPTVPVIGALPLALPIPPGRAGAAAALDGARGQVMLFGGIDPGGQVLADTWTFNGAIWAQPPLQRSPPARHGAVATWDPGISEVVVFGGIGASGAPLDDTWIWSGSIWKNLLPTLAKPPAGVAAGLTFDTARQELVLVTTGPADPVQLGAVDGETWTWAGESWGRLTSAQPPVLSGPATVTYDASLSKTILVDVRTNTTWSFDGTTWTREPASGLALDPAAVTQAAYDAAAGEVVLVQNGHDGAAASTTWTFDGSAWRSALAPLAPAQVGSLTPDPGSGGVIALAGAAAASDVGMSARLTSAGWGPVPKARP